MSTLLPPPKIQFIDGNGNPLAGGSVFTYIPGTSVTKATFQDSGSTIQNTNPIILDAAGRAIVYGNGSYRFLVLDSAGNQIYDALTSDTAIGGLAWGGTSTGTPNSQVIAASSFSQQDGQQISFLVGAGLTNTGGATVSPGGGSGIAILKDTVSGPTALTGGELAAGNAVLLVYDAARGAFHLVDNPQIANFGGALATIPSATTTDLGSVVSHNISITPVGTPVNSFGSSAQTVNPLYQLSFTGSLTLAYNATSMILQGGANIVTAAGDSAVMLYLGSGNWRMLSYARAAVAPNTGAGIAGGFRSLVITVPSPTTLNVAAAGLTLYDSNGNPAYIGVFSQGNNNASNGAGGLDTGAIATSTWYNVFVIYNPSNQAVATLISLSATAPTLPAGYTFSLRVGAVRNAASGGYWRTIQYGRRATVVVGTNPTTTPIIASGVAGNVTTPTWVAQSVLGFVPPTASVIYINIGCLGSTTIVAPNNQYGNNTSTTNPPYAAFQGGTGSAQTNIAVNFILESTNIYYAASNSNGNIVLNGWEDNL